MLRGAILSLALLIGAAPAWADARLTVLMDLLKVSEVTAILRREGLEYAGELDADMLGGQGGAFLTEQVDRIYDSQRMDERLRTALATGLTDAEKDAAISWFSSDAGGRIVALENAARAAMSDPAVEQAAREAWEQSVDAGDPKVVQVGAYMEDLDLVERNVSGTMTSNYQFLLGLSDGGLLVQSQDQMLADVYAQRDEIEADTESWLGAFLLMAYQPVGTDDLKAYIAFSTTDAGKALNSALFAGFDTVFGEISYALGRAVALSAAGNDI
ncbi:DUF2059 domain-containing protein [uncultured Roseobacter sp.]|uniref:DUF2059 domain-containing protein n=1 Tax=uncultured Roseobacter sp. TaxID=114847 RepID=UPI00260D2BA2|nr:DUF2059 domain-containing protein [uncultured Roseobacter sp.]